MQTTLPATGLPRADYSPRLRPLGVGDLLDEVFSLYRRGFRPLVSITALAGVPLAILSLWQLQLVASGDQALLPLASMVLNVVGLVLGSLQIAAVCSATSALILGQTPGVAPAWRRARDRFWALVRLALLGGVAFTVGTIALCVVAGLLAVLGALVLQATVPGIAAGLLAASVSVGIGVAIGALALVIWVLWSLAVPVLVVEERTGAVAAIRRGRALAKGGVGRILLNLLALIALCAVLQIIAWLLVAVVTGQLSTVWHAATSGGSPALVAALGPAGQPVAVWVLRTLLSSALSLVLAPLLGIGMTLVYYDRRVRVEAYDLSVRGSELARSE